MARKKANANFTEQISSGDGTEWHSIDIEELLTRLDTEGGIGLTNQEAQLRLEKYGPNQLKEAPPITFWQMLLGQLNNFVVILLIAAAIISAVLGDYFEAVVIIAIVILNTTLGVVQERRAEQAIAALRRLAAPEATIIRDGSRQVVPSYELVPGDLVLLEAGHYVPADVRLLEAINLRVDEAALTGESVPVQKNAHVFLETELPLGDRKNSAFMGTMVNYGRGRGIVVSTGMTTQIGLIAEMLQAVEQEQTPLQRKLNQIGKTLGWAALGICGLVFVIGWLRGFDPLEMFMISVSLAIAAVPEGLPAVVTISLAIGMQEMIRRHALIRRLSSVETLGSATVICSDKTGTLTQNEMTVTGIWVDGFSFSVTGVGYAPTGEFLLDGRAISPSDYPGLTSSLWVGMLNNDANLEKSGTSDEGEIYRMVGDPTEGALIVAAAKAGAWQADLDSAYPRFHEVPFDSTRKRMVTVHSLTGSIPEDISPLHDDQHQEDYAVTVKGAPDIVLDQCSYFQRMDDTVETLDEKTRMQILAANDRMTQDALRVLGMAYRIAPKLDSENPETYEKDMVFVGLVGMIDPPRPEVPPALMKARKAGIRTIMITGDYINTARAIAESIGLLSPGHRVLSGAELNDMDEATLQREIKYTDVFARVSPEHKIRIVEALRSDNEVVAMTGDGVNDAPAIKKADIGIAMGITGTDVAKESADMVLTDDNYASIVSAVEQGRIIYSNIRKFVYYLLSCNLAEIAIIFLGIMFTRGSPLTVIQLLWLNLITDGAPALALGNEKGDPGIMDQPPRPPSEPIINRFMQVGIFFQTIAITSVTLTAYLLGYQLFPDQPEIARTMAFVTLSFSELLRAYTARSEYYSLIKIGIFSNRYMNYAFLASFTLLMGVIYIPFLQPVFETVSLSWQQWQIILSLLFVPSIVAELTKYFALRTQLRKSQS